MWGGGAVTDYPKRNEPNDWAEIDVVGVANMPPSGDELDALVDQHPAPPEWEEEWDRGGDP